VQLTKDQKPDDPEEMERIISNGGRVEQLKDHNGQGIGPFRVWKLHEDTPGLAMARSIGDTIGAEVGVIPTPITSSYDLIPGNDFFIIVGSDGLWDVIEN
jgi:serine/threonine protein phosphatase PrpC